MDIELVAVAVVPVQHAWSILAVATVVYITEVGHRVGEVLHGHLFRLVIDILAQVACAGVVGRESEGGGAAEDIKMTVVVSFFYAGEILVGLGPGGAEQRSVVDRLTWVAASTGRMVSCSE